MPTLTLNLWPWTLDPLVCIYLLTAETAGLLYQGIQPRDSCILNKLPTNWAHLVPDGLLLPPILPPPPPPPLPSPPFLFLFLYWRQSFTLPARLVLNFQWSFWLCLLSAVITDMHHHTQFAPFFEQSESADGYLENLRAGCCSKPVCYFESAL